MAEIATNPFERTADSTTGLAQILERHGSSFIAYREVKERSLAHLLSRPCMNVGSGCDDVRRISSNPTYLTP